MAADEHPETVEVVVDSDPASGYSYYPSGPGTGGALRDGRGIACEIPRDQYEQWQATEEAALAMQAEIRALIDAAPVELPQHPARFVLVAFGKTGEPCGAHGPYSEGRARSLLKHWPDWSLVPLSD